jgi:pimeloyl-ACP methyl ester carboxylesterase
MSTIQTRYAKSADVHIAYQVVGEGQVDLVVVNGWVTNLELMWEAPASSAFFRRDDVRAVMDALGSSPAFVFGVSEGGPMSVLFAGGYPQRRRGPAFGSFPRITRSEDYPWGFAPEQLAIVEYPRNWRRSWRRT